MAEQIKQGAHGPVVLFCTATNVQSAQIRYFIQQKGSKMTFDDISKLNSSEFPSFSSFAKDQLPMPGTKKHIEDVLDKQILVVDYKVRKSKKREDSNCLQLQFIYNDEVCVLFTGSSVLLDQINIIADKTSGPFYVTITRIHKYYSFS